jgi:hypothetical protein
VAPDILQYQAYRHKTFKNNLKSIKSIPAKLLFVKVISFPGRKCFLSPEEGKKEGFYLIRKVLYIKEI